MRTLVDRLRPRSDEGDVYRDSWVESSEPIFYGGLVLIGGGGGASLIANGQLLGGIGWIALAGTMCAFARWVFFRPHLVIGDDVLVLVGRLRTRRVTISDVRHAVASDGALKLAFVDREVHVPGHYLWSHARGRAYSDLARTINAKIGGHRRDTS